MYFFSRNNSGASTTKKRIRANSSSSNHGYGEFFTTKKLRVEVTKLEELTDHSVDAFSSADETCPNSGMYIRVSSVIEFLQRWVKLINNFGKKSSY